MKHIRFEFLAIALVAAAGLGLGLYVIFSPKPVWIVEDRYTRIWESVLADSDSPLRNARVIPRSVADDEDGDLMSRSRYGYRIVLSPGPQRSAENTEPVRVYRALAREMRYGRSLALALDPWLVFRKFTVPSLSREAIENGAPAGGQIFLAGSDPNAITAWAAQLLQKTPGAFPAEAELWEQTRHDVSLSQVFQRGASTYSWTELWSPLLDENENVWIYAPLSQVRTLPVYRANVLEADVFPIRPGWTEFGIQADILWAVPYGSERNRKKLNTAETWLRSAELQALLADTMNWLAAHPEAPPYNPVSGNARIAWLTSSYVWTMTAQEAD